MECRALSGPLSRAISSPLLSFLSPSLCSATQSTTTSQSLTASSALSCIAPRRHFSLATRRQSEAAAAAPRPEPEQTEQSEQLEDPLAGIFNEQNDPRQATRQESGPSRTRGSSSSARINARLDALSPPNITRSRDPLFATRRDSSITKASNRGGIRPGGIAGGMLIPNRRIDDRETAKNIIADEGAPVRRSKKTVRSRPALGRTIEVEPTKGIDFGQALRKLDILLATNKVRSEQRRQKFHERPGLKRKRLKSERYRAYFKSAFTAAVARVKMMKSQGW